MPRTFDRELRQLLESAGCHRVRSGKHEIWYSPLTRRNFAVPTRIVSRHTANGILKDAGLPKKF
jgi:predicted RNA binding protein YcfA (HicA-like mRNA interferase family)